MASTSLSGVLTKNSKVDSRIIIDTYAWNRFNPNRQVSLATLTKSAKRAPVTPDSDDEGEDEDEDEYNEDYTDYEDDSGCEEVLVENSLKSLTKDQLLLCSASLKGYSLRNKKWLTFSIGSVKDIEYNENAFESLVLPEDHKELILALTESQVANKETFDDVIQGKGKGMIMLLSGPPGVGKTLTAESGECIRPLSIPSNSNKTTQWPKV